MNLAAVWLSAVISLAPARPEIRPKPPQSRSRPVSTNLELYF